ncbi:MAG: ribosome small subunit-dependent GTPase A [Lachnospiraceae bacterium]|nr:ribosome small subunit-dependent GTPase A [Lachnospiraceae bacterium]
MTGKIIKGIAGFYYVFTTLGLVECKAKGTFRKEGIKPLVGDNVELDIISDDEGDLKGNIIKILKRKNSLIRPSSANIDQALIIFAITKPDPNYNLLDRFLISMKKEDIPTVVCFNKKDIATSEEIEALRAAYEGCGCKVLFVSGIIEDGLDDILNVLKGKTTVVAGPSGVGKSTIVNALYPEANMETGEISRKIERGKHTTRHAEIFALNLDTFIIDTPGFTSLNVEGVDKENLWKYYSEFIEYEENCKFAGCSHISEPVCGIKEAVNEEKISRIRYNNYVQIYKEINSKKLY